VVSDSRNDSLDGLRLLAVAGVFAFHLRVPGARAGFLGVDLFFVLSGYLITSILLRQVEGGRVRLGEFWTRRARRLIPALIPVVVVVLVWGAVVLAPVSRDRLRADLTSTLFYFANWHFISTSTYFASDGVVSPLEHMWSLGVEEQFYLGWPVLLALVAVCLRRPRQRAIAVGLIAATGVALSVWRLAGLWSGAGGHDRAYLGTDSRIFQPLAGALLAVLVTSPRVRAAFARAHWALLTAGVAGLAWGMVALGDSDGATAVYAHGGAAAVAASTAAVLAAVVTAGSIVTRTLALPPVAYLGRLSYGIYLWHWPLVVWTAQRGWWDLTGLGAPLRDAIVVAMTIALAALSYSFVEVPVRYGSIASFLGPRRTLALLAGVLVMLFAAGRVTVVPYAGAALGRTTKTIVLVGDSVPQRLAPELSAAAAAHGYVVISATRGSCPASGVALVDSRGKPWGPGTRCATDVPARQDAAVAGFRPALVIWWSRYELADRVDARGRPVRFGSRAYWALQRQAFVRRTTALTAKGAVVVAVEIERSGVGIRSRCNASRCGPLLSRLVHAVRSQSVWNSFLASHRTGSVRAIDIQPLVCRDAGSPCNDRLPDGSPARPDGTHYGPAAAPRIARAVIDRALAAARLGTY
jgi:peptidoglycan/LPS O-acetylase OafA/YrhL